MSEAPGQLSGREASFAERLRRLIRRNGPIPLAQVMGESNAYYYNARDPLGEEGDFLTAPEISQMFGEMIGIWLTDLWGRAGKPENIAYVELGPGRGTLASDALRVAARFGLAPEIHFVEASRTLRAVQAQRFPKAIHHEDCASLEEIGAPLLAVANEFFDALPVRQLVRTAQGWRERMVGLEGEDFVFVAGDKPMDAAVPQEWRDLEVGAIVEACPAAAAQMGELARLIARRGGAALVIDYGALHPRTGSSLQAIARHRKRDPLTALGEADLTAHVDFARLAQVARANGAKVSAMTTQRAFLQALGIETRLEALRRSAPQSAEMLARQYHRLVDAGQMGELFKVLAIRAPDWPDGAGLG